MAISLDAIALPDDLIWIDEFDWSPVVQSQAYSLTGALILESGQRLAGRPMTLAGSETAAWTHRSTVSALYSALSTDAVMTLTLNDNRTFSVRFRHDSRPVEANPIIDYNNPIATDFYTLTVRFLIV